jgi:hypothetical protein
MCWDLPMNTPERENSTTVVRRTAREHGFLALFTLSLAWAIYQVGVMLMLWRGEEGSTLPAVAAPVVAVVAAGLVTAVLVRRAPDFLRAPARVSSLRLSVSLLVTAAIVATALLVIPLVVTTLVDPPGPRADVQYVPPAFWIAPWAAGALTPVITILIAWWWTRRAPRAS